MTNGNIYGGYFVSPDEKQISTIGTGYVANFVSGSGVYRAGATQTNKRVYFSGSIYFRDGRGKFAALNQRKIVNIRDITGTGYDFYKPLHLILWSILFLVASIVCFALVDEVSETFIPFGILGIILCISMFISYFMRKMTLLSIEYAGGIIAFNVKWMQQHEQDHFIQNIHLAKDKLFSTAAADQGFVTSDPDPANSTKICTNCGTQLPANAVFCGACGNKV